jgi:5-methylcytosine-specific restriction protein A
MIRSCINSSCPNPATYKGRCREHARHNNRNINRAGYDTYRTKRWYHARRRILFDHPLCAECGAIATDVHHIIDLADGGDPYAPTNLSALCHACHARHTRHVQTTRA